MLEAPDLNIDSVVVYMQNSDYLRLAQRIKEAFQLQRDLNGAPLRYAHSEDVANALYHVLKISTNLPVNGDLKTLIKELFRAVRNYVVNPEVRMFLATDLDFLPCVKYCLVNILSDSSNDDILQSILQFLNNLVIQSEVACVKVFRLFITSVHQMLNIKKCVKEASALMYNLSLYNLLDSLDATLYSTVLDCYSSTGDNEFLHFLLESFLISDRFWHNYKDLSLNHRLVVLELVRDQQIKKMDVDLPQSAAKTLADKFTSSSQIIFQTVTTTNLEAYEVSLLLDVLSSLCANEISLKFLQDDKNFLIQIGVLLINMQRLGKLSENCFSSIQRLSEVKESTEDIRQHPAFGFKAGLIRIIGNLCWKNTLMQDLVREAELIPVILDCCNIDARNPFIMQWAIFAIRNACENNSKNQAVIAGMHQTGSVSSATLDEMGLTLHNDGSNSIKVVPLDLLRK